MKEEKDLSKMKFGAPDGTVYWFDEDGFISESSINIKTTGDTNEVRDI